LKIAIVTDSVADVPESLRKELGITVVPLSIIFGDETFIDGVDLDIYSFYTKLKASKVMPSTSQPSPADFMKVYTGLLDENDYVFSIHASSALSGTYQSAVLAKETLAADNVEVIDSRQATMCEGFVAVEAARAAARGAGTDAVRRRIEQTMASVRLLFVVDTLEYLAKNGRIGRAASLVGALLSVKPILSIEDGVVAPFEKVIGARKAFHRVIQSMKEQVGSERVSAAVLHCNAPYKAEEWKREVEANFDCAELIVADVGAVVGAHVGPGAAGIVWHTLPQLV
jgi:DegV family protein with EDD domain